MENIFDNSTATNIARYNFWILFLKNNIDVLHISGNYAQKIFAIHNNSLSYSVAKRYVILTTGSVLKYLLIVCS